ncbi:MAG TPA: L,D-transpeptidase family protein [Kiritimatiellia bacterium]|nr:L,D-transpeptidase family protein [Kiritimatiellia bacterium]HMO98982.1 L,D-transpeptidase family protein [Kiritimatiellia bacterium]HMP96693.1 L,D-transpeptidase family protein [Kiritimatiellia bacterium]
MNLSAYNLERTRAPRRRTPWWVYAGAIALAVLLIWGLVKALPGKRERATAAPEPVVEETTTTVPSVSPAAAAAPAVPPPPAATPRVEPPPRPVAAPTPPTATPVETTGIAGSLAPAREALTAGDFLRARELALTIWNQTAERSPEQRAAEAILNEAGIALVLSPRPMPEKVEYTVQPGDSLEKIARKFGTTIELLRAGNNIRGHLIRVGDRLRIFTGKFSVAVSKSENDLVLFMNDQFFKRYRVGTGEYNKTPVGDFVINDRIAQPTWWRPDGKSIPFGDPENLLGTHWLSINVKGYGLHGTWEPESIGHQLSAGCVRMLNEDIEQLFTLLPLGTPVSIRD